MASSVVFGNKVCKLPGSYARVVSGISKEAALANYSNFLLIDAGAGNGFVSTKGIIGNGKECVYALDEESANYYVKGGPLEPVVSSLFSPADGKPGIGTLYLIKAASSTPASITNPSFFGGKLTATSVKTVEEGPICNSYPASITSYSDLKKGYALRCVYSSTLGKGYVEIYQGSYSGTNFKGYTIGDVEANSGATLVYRSKKCATVADLVTYLSKSTEVKNLLKIEGLKVTSPSFGSTDIDETFKFTSGSETYVSKASELNEIFGHTLNSDYSCMMVAEANGDTKFLSVALDHVINDAKGIKQIITAKAEKEDAILLAQEMDSDQLIVCCGEVQNTSKSSSTGFITHDVFVTAAKCAGRIFGLSPEVAGTLKSLGIDGMEVEPSDSDLEDMLDAGVISPYYDADLGGFVLSQVCNSLQKNTELFNDDCSTYSVQAKRILAQVVKNLTYQSKIDFWGGEQGVNKATLSDAYVKAWTETLLNKLSIAPNKTENNYLMSYEVTKVETVDDTKRVSLSVTINGEITKVFFLVTVLG